MTQLTWDQRIDLAIARKDESKIIEPALQVGDHCGFLELIALEPYKHLGKQKVFKCRCVCGTILTKHSSSLAKRSGKSCGCIALVQGKDTNDPYACVTLVKNGIPLQ